MEPPASSAPTAAVAVAGVSLAVVLSFGFGMLVGASVHSDDVHHGEESTDHHSQVATPTTVVESMWSEAMQVEEMQSEAMQVEGGDGLQDSPCLLREQEQSDAGRRVCVLDAWVEGGELNLMLEHRGYEPSIGSGMHAHVFSGEVKPVNAGAPGDASIGGGSWQVVELDFMAISVSDSWAAELLESGMVCAALATERHTLANLDVSCAPIR